MRLLMNDIKTRFANLKLQYKLMLTMAGVTTLALLAITVTTYQNYFSTNFASEMDKSEQAVSRASNSLHGTLSALTLKTSRLLLDPTVKQVILKLEMNEMESYAAGYQSISSILESYVDSNDVLISAYLFSPSYLYGTMSAGPRQNPYGIMDDTVWDVSVITYRPYNYNSQTQASHVVPILYPVTSMYAAGGTMLNYGTSQHGQPICFAAFLDERYLTETLSRFSTSMTDGFYLLNQDGMPLNHNFGTISEENLFRINQFVMEQEELHNAALVIDGDTYYITSREIGNNGLQIVHIFSNSQIIRSIRPMMLFLILIWVLGIIASGFLSSVIAHFLTRPFRKLTEVIEQINQNNYTEKAEFLYQDESGLLGKQINQMYDTIQRQILLIKEEEQQKAKAEIQMYTEQINPHFLYNTLECIHFQMLNDHKDAACLMLGSLGKYLRLTLSHGQTMIPVAKEIEHVTEYMTIINRHSAAARIAFSCRCEESLLSVRILKLILQPLAENAIKHGFPQDLASYMVPPAITIEIRQDGSSLLLSVTDNGQGFDASYVQSCMTNADFEHGTHFGLHNVYQRLMTCYGEDAGISFESVPYYMNSVVISIPVKGLIENQLSG